MNWTSRQRRDQNEKNTDLLRLRLYVDNERIACESVVRDLKDKSKLTFQLKTRPRRSLRNWANGP